MFTKLLIVVVVPSPLSTVPEVPVFSAGVSASGCDGAGTDGCHAEVFPLLIWSYLAFAYLRIVPIWAYRLLPGQSL